MCRMPKGIADFELLRKNHYVYIDKTKYIELLELGSARYIHFLRPRRFGKTLFTSMLCAYYDINMANEFEDLFKGTYIYEHPTKERNAYRILRFDFSGLNTNSTEVLEKEFSDRVYDCCIRFYKNYHIKQDLEKRSAAGILSQFLTMLDQIPVYVIIDEYDHFANELLSFHVNDYQEVVSKDGFVRKFYEVLKTHTVNSVIKRIFITGVSPITLDSMTSGYNISTNLSLESDFNELCGFTSEEMKHLISQVDHMDQPEKTLMEMKQIYDGYLFSEDGEHHLYNPNMSLYYLEYMQRKGSAPKEIVDPNIYSDYRKIQNLLNIKSDPAQSDALMEIMKNGSITCKLTKSFELSTKFTKDDFISLLYYLGYLTIDQQIFDEVTLRVPNEVIRTVYFNYFNAMLEQNFHVDITMYSQITRQLLLEKRNDLLVKQIELSLHELSNRDYTKFDEKYVKLVAMSIVGVSNYIRIESEKEANGGYADLVLYPYQTTGATSIIELKFLKKEDATEEKIKEKRDEAYTQLNQYATSKAFDDIDVVKWILIFSKDQCVWNETVPV